MTRPLPIPFDEFGNIPIEITPKREAILALAARAIGVTGDELDPNLTALHMAGYLEQIGGAESLTLKITQAGRERLAHDDFELGREVYDDREPESEGEFIDMIEQSICDSGDGLCLYVGNHCIKCREPAPWVRNGCGQL